MNAVLIPDPNIELVKSRLLVQHGDLVELYQNWYKIHIFTHESDLTHGDKIASAKRYNKLRNAIESKGLDFMETMFNLSHFALDIPYEE